MKKHLWLTGFFVLLGASATARADILFVDVNFNQEEVATAQRMAKKKGEELVLVPRLSDQDRKELYAATAKVNQLEHQSADFVDRLSKLYKQRSDAQAGSPKLAALESQISKLEAQFQAVNDESTKRSEELSALQKRMTSGTVQEQIERAVSEMESRGKAPSTLILSSHHGGNQFFGRLGGLPDKDVFEVIGRHPETSKALTSMLFWGCYSASKAQVLRWRAVLPNVKLISGFDGSGPKQDKAIDHILLEEVLGKQEQLLKMQEVGDVQRFFRQIPQLMNSGATAAMCVNNVYVSRAGAEKLENVTSNCTPELVAKVIQGDDLFKKYMDAKEEGFLDVPSNTQNSDLRTFYTQVRQSEHCPQLELISTTDKGDHAVRLIFFKQLAKNFALKYGSMIAALKPILKANSLNDIEVPDLTSPSLRRSDVMRFVEKMKLAGSLIAQDAGVHPSARTTEERIADIREASQASRVFERILGNLNCAPLSWVEPAASASALEEPSNTCINGPDGSDPRGSR